MIYSNFYEMKKKCVDLHVQNCEYFYQFYSPIRTFYSLLLLAHLNQRLNWAIAIAICPASVRLSVC